MFVHPLGTTKAFSPWPKLPVGIVIVLIGALSSALFVVAAQSKPSTPYRGSFVASTGKLPVATSASFDVLPDVARDAEVVAMVCRREDALAPFWLCE